MQQVIHSRVSANANTGTRIEAHGCFIVNPTSSDLDLRIWPTIQPLGGQNTLVASVLQASTFDFPHSTNQTDLATTGGGGTGLLVNVTMAAAVAAVTVDNAVANYKYADAVTVTGKTGTVASGTDVLALCDDTTPTGNDAAFDETITFTGDDSAATCSARVVMADVGGTLTITSLALTSAITGANHTETFSGTADNASGAGDVTVSFTVTAAQFDEGTFTICLTSGNFQHVQYKIMHDAPSPTIAADFVLSNTTDAMGLLLVKEAL